jgi:hypothetical protein
MPSRKEVSEMYAIVVLLICLKTDTRLYIPEFEAVAN